MSETTASALSGAPEFVADQIRAGLSPHYTFHTYGRAERIVKLCEEIAEGTDLKRADRDILLLAAWFLDIGYTESAASHEEHSVRIAAGYLEQQGVSEDVVARVAKCIRATSHQAAPENLLEEILCDADSAFLGGKKFARHLALLRLEQETIRGRHFTEAEWLQESVELLARRRFHTPYARSRFEKRRSDHLVKLRERLRSTLEREQARRAKEDARRADLEAKAEREKRPQRGIETMFRTAPQNHLNLSSIADHKANILISVNALVISIVLTQMFRSLDELQALLLPTVTLLGVCVLTIVFATLATKPKLTTGRFTRDDIEQKRANLLFFGNFYKMSYEDFEAGMHAMMNDADYLYGSMTRDFFNLGQVLGRKYFYLRIAYNVFMYGIVLAVLMFVIALVP
jgi:predicted metal-dependent HD superfamily phosphohydrolase